MLFVQVQRLRQGKTYTPDPLLVPLHVRCGVSLFGFFFIFCSFLFFFYRGLEIRERGYTPLAVALRYNKRECVEVLMDAGAKLSSLPLHVRIPEWALDYYDEVNDRMNACKTAVIVLLALQRRMRERCPILGVVVPQKNMQRIIEALWETRRNRAWGTASTALVPGKPL